MRAGLQRLLSRLKVSRIIAIALGLWLLWVLLAGDSNLVQLWKLKSENAEIEDEIATLEERLSEIATEDSTARIAPVARLLKTEVGTMNMPRRAITTVMPEKVTARVAVSAEASIASSRSWPAARCSRNLATMNSE